MIYPNMYNQHQSQICIYVHPCTHPSTYPCMRTHKIYACKYICIQMHSDTHAHTHKNTQPCMNTHAHTIIQNKTTQYDTAHKPWNSTIWHNTQNIFNSLFCNHGELIFWNSFDRGIQFKMLWQCDSFPQCIMLWAVTQFLEGCRHVWTNVVTSHHHLCAERLHANNQLTWLEIHSNITSLHSIKPRVKTGGPVSELRGYVKEEVVVLNSMSLTDRMASVDVKQHWNEWRHKLNSINVTGKQGLYMSDINPPHSETTVKINAILKTVNPSFETTFLTSSGSILHHSSACLPAERASNDAVIIRCNQHSGWKCCDSVIPWGTFLCVLWMS